jgi:adenylate cyclase
MERYQPQYHLALRASNGVDLGVHALCYTYLCLWTRGYPDQALQQSQRALDLARFLGHNYSIVYALHLGASLHRLRRDPTACRVRVEEMLPLARELGTPQLVAWGTILQGWVLTVQGEVAEGLAHIQEGLHARQARGMELTRPMYLALLAEAYGRHGQPEEGLRGLAEALRLVEKNDERYFESELYRLEGELRYQAAGAWLVMDVTPEASFYRALDVARQQQAKSLELRAATSLARLWQSQGKRREAYNLLAPVYDWFTEGFDTADLQAAKALLEAIA